MQILWFGTPPFSFLQLVSELLYYDLGVGSHYAVHGSSHGICGVDLRPLQTNVSSLVFDLPFHMYKTAISNKQTQVKCLEL